LHWQRLGPVADLAIDVAYGRDHREVAIRWKGVACEHTWRLSVSAPGLDGSIVLQPTMSGDCVGADVVRRLVIEFDQPVDLKQFRTTDPCCG
ncbi:MAG TPA: hypothetical protein VGM49_07980, partial [Candidatus Limnocylindrales bacterium]